MGKKWTQDDDRKLISLIVQQTPIDEIGATLKRTIQAIEDRAWTLGYSKKRVFVKRPLERAKIHREQELGLLRPRG